MNNKPSPNSNKQFFIKYATLGTQLIAAIGLSVFVGLKADKWLNTLPVFACALPLLTLVGIFYKLAKETAKPPKDEK